MNFNSKISDESFSNELTMKMGQVADAKDEFYEQLIRHLPGAVYTCNIEGYITFYNGAAAALWGREPELGKDLWCGSWKMHAAFMETTCRQSCEMRWRDMR